MSPPPPFFPFPSFFPSSERLAQGRKDPLLKERGEKWAGGEEGRREGRGSGGREGKQLIGK